MRFIVRLRCSWSLWERISIPLFGTLVISFSRRSSLSTNTLLLGCFRVSEAHRISVIASCEMRVATLSRPASSGSTAEMRRISDSRATVAPPLFVKTIVVAPSVFAAFKASTKSPPYRSALRPGPGLDLLSLLLSKALSHDSWCPPDLDCVAGRRRKVVYNLIQGLNGATQISFT